MLTTQKELPTFVDKIPGCCADGSEFKAGDILIFNVNPIKQNTHPIVFSQKMLNNPGGHQDAIHTDRKSVV